MYKINHWKIKIEMSIPTTVREDLINLKAKRKDHKRAVDLTSLKSKMLVKNKKPNWRKVCAANMRDECQGILKEKTKSSYQLITMHDSSS